MKPEFPQSSREELEMKVTALLMGELSAEEAAKLKELMKDDAELAALHEQLKEAFGLVQETVTKGVNESHEAVQLSSERREKLLSTFRGKESEESPARQAIDWRIWGTLAAMVVGLLGVAAVAFKFLVDPPVERASVTETLNSSDVEWAERAAVQRILTDRTLTKEMAPQKQEPTKNGAEAVARRDSENGHVFLPTDPSINEKRLAQAVGKEVARPNLQLPTGGSGAPNQPPAVERPSILLSDNRQETTTLRLYFNEQKSQLAGDIADLNGDGHIALPAESKMGERFSAIPDEKGEKGIDHGKAENRSSFVARLGSIVNGTPSGPSGNGGPAPANPEPGLSTPGQPGNMNLSVTVAPAPPSQSTLPTSLPPVSAPVPQSESYVIANAIVPPPAVVAIPPPIVSAPMPGPDVAGGYVASGSGAAPKKPAGTPDLFATELDMAQVTDREKKDGPASRFGLLQTNFTLAATNRSQPMAIDGSVNTYTYGLNGGDSLLLPMTNHLLSDISGNGRGLGRTPNSGLNFYNEGSLGGSKSGRAGFGEGNRPGATSENKPQDFLPKADGELARRSDPQPGEKRSGVDGKEGVTVGRDEPRKPSAQQGVQNYDELQGQTSSASMGRAGGKVSLQTGTEVSRGEGLNQLAQQQAVKKVPGPEVSTPAPNANYPNKEAASGNLAGDVIPGGAINFKDGDISQVLDKYQELTGRTVVRPKSLPDAKVTFENAAPMTKKEAVRTLDEVLAMNQITMIPQGNKFMKAVPQAEAPQEGAPFFEQKTVNQARGIAPSNHEFELRERQLQNAQAVREKLSMRIVQEEVEVALPKQRIVQIIDRAEPPKPGFWDRVKGEVASTVRIKVEKDGTDVSGLSAEGFGGGFDPYWMQDQFETIQSKSVLYKVIEKLKLDSAWGLSKEQAYTALKDRVEATQSRGTSLVEIRVKSKDPEEAARIANTIAEAYAESRLQLRKEYSSHGIETLRRQLKETDEKVRKAQIELNELKAKQESSKPTQAPAKPRADLPVPQPEVMTSSNAFSTFSLNVSDVSFKLAGASLEKGTLPDAASIRSEEFINAFDYHDPEPVGSAPIAFNWERARYSFAYGRDLLRFSVKTAAVGRQAGRPLNLVLLLDNSGSMERADRVQIRMECLRVLAGQLQPQDRVSVVAFARTARLWVDGLAGNQAGDLPQRVGTLNPEGGTNLEEAMNLAYQTALKHFLPSGMNRVVLLTDGAANLGDVQPESLKKKVESFRKQGVALDCFGIGWEGYNDDLLEALSRNGDGRYGFVNTPEAARTEFANQLAGALKVAASDVKVQVEFNPKRATAYRQIGYAKHQLTKEQFRDNTVDAAEIAAAETGNALYVVEVNAKGEGPIATVRVRFKVPGTTDYREHAWAVPYNGEATDLARSSNTLRLAATASAFSEWLTDSPYAAEVTSDKLLGLLNGVPKTFGADPRPKRLEWMIRQAKSISGK